jgi:hypothetical protein
MMSWWCCHKSGVDMTWRLRRWRDDVYGDDVDYSKLENKLDFLNVDHVTWWWRLWQRRQQHDVSGNRQQRNDELSMMSSTSWTSNQVASYHDVTVVTTVTVSVNSGADPDADPDKHGDRTQSRATPAKIFYWHYIVDSLFNLILNSMFLKVEK